MRERGVSPGLEMVEGHTSILEVLMNRGHPVRLEDPHFQLPRADDRGVTGYIWVQPAVIQQVHLIGIITEKLLAHTRWRVAMEYI